MQALTQLLPGFLEPRRETVSEAEFACSVRVKSSNFVMPPIHDALVLGKDSPIGFEALRKAVLLLQPTDFVHIEIGSGDDVIGDILVRSSLLKKIPKDKFVDLVLRRFKPLMNPSECLHLDVDVEMLCELQL